MKKSRILFICLLFATGLYAEDQVLQLTLSEAQEYAVQQNRSLKNASLAVQQAHAQRWQTIASMLPQVQGNLGYTNMCGYEIDFGGMSSGGNSTMDMLNAIAAAVGVDASQYLDGSSSASTSRKMLPYLSAGVQASIALNGQMIVGALLNNIAIDMQNITYEQSETNLRSSVTTSYVSVLVMQDIIQLLDSSLNNIEALAEMTQQSVNVGAVEQTSADQLKVRVNTLKNNINSSKRNLELAKNSLKVLLAVPATTEIVLLSDMNDLLSAEKVLNLLGQDFNISNNLNYQLLQKNTEIAKQNVNMAAVAYAPTLSAYYQYNYRHDFGEGGFSMSPPHTVGVSLSVPLFTSGKNGAAIKDKQLAYEQAVNTFQETTDNLGIQYQQLRFNLQNAYETYMNEKDNIDVTQRVFASTTNKYQWGTASNLELTNASNDLINAQSSYVQAVLSLVNAQVELEKFLNNK
ncbi:MAG: TolC family protein [Paludibacteraceae bacterium]|nr:TolC family protein [Paludibacteraceae bacterium]